MLWTFSLAFNCTALLFRNTVEKYSGEIQLKKYSGEIHLKNTLEDNSAFKEPFAWYSSAALYLFRNTVEKYSWTKRCILRNTPLLAIHLVNTILHTSAYSSERACIWTGVFRTWNGVFCTWDSGFGIWESVFRYGLNVQDRFLMSHI